MVTNSTKRRPEATSWAEEIPVIVPTPANVRALAAEIRKGWTPRQRRRRAVLARRMMERQLVWDSW